MKTVICNLSAFIFILLSGAMSVTAQEVPVSVEAIDLKQVPLVLDKDLGVSIARLGEGELHQVDATMVEIPPGGRFPAHRHLAEEIVYIIAGEGYTTMRQREGDKPVRYDWKAGDLISPSLNVWHEHVNDSDAPARYVSITSIPVSRNLFPYPAFLAGSDFVFEDRWQQGVTQQPEYVPEGGFESSTVVRMKVGHMLPDIDSRSLKQRRKGAWGITITPEGDLAGNRVLEMEVREKDGEEFTDDEAHMHRHPWEVVYIVLDGEGYSNMQKEGEPKRRVNWKKGDMLIMEANEYHDNRAQQHTRTRYLQVKAAGYFHDVGNVGGIVLEGE